jgi:hypothetical protein
MKFNRQTHTSLTGSGPSGDPITLDFMQLSRSMTPMELFGVLIVLAVKPGLSKKMVRFAELL